MPGLWGLGQSASGVSPGSGIGIPWRAGIFLCEAGIGAHVAPCQAVLPLPSGQAPKLQTRVSGQDGGPQGAAGSSGVGMGDCPTGATRKASWRGRLQQQ